MKNRIPLDIYVLFFMSKLFGIFPNVHITNGNSFVYNFSKFWFLYSVLFHIFMAVYTNIVSHVLSINHMYSAFSDSVSFVFHRLLELQNLISQFYVVYNNKTLTVLVELAALFRFVVVGLAEMLNYTLMFPYRKHFKFVQTC